jgi:hypothetical protein
MLILIKSGFAGCVPIPDPNSVSEKIRLSGYLMTEQFWGPPNFGEKPKTDMKFTTFLLKLDVPKMLCGSDIEANQTKILDCIELVNTGPKSLKSYIGKHITVKGSLFGAHTGWHITPILFDEERFVLSDSLSFINFNKWKNYRCQLTAWSGQRIN